MKILIAEDDIRLLKSLKHILEIHNFSVDAVDNGLDALSYAESCEYDGLVLDIMMPGMDGIEVLKKLRAGGMTAPALFLTARTEVEQRVEGLDAGADDYLSKPFSTDELLARIRAMLRRRESFTPDISECEGLRFNRSTYELSYEGHVCALSRMEFLIMEMLIENPHAIISTNQLMTHIWGWNSSVDTSVIWVHISNIRKKLSAMGAPVRIRFLRGAGYILEKDE